MRILITVSLFNLLPAILAQRDIINEDLGDLHIHAKVGDLPKKYYRKTETDIHASEKAADVVEFVYLVPNLDPLTRESLVPLGIDIPFLWLSGKVFMKNFVLAGIKSVILKNVELRLNNLRADVNLTVPQIYFEGDFHLQAKLSFLPIIFKCHLSAYLMDMDISVAAGGKKAVVPQTGEVLQIESAEIQVDIKDVQFNLTDIVIGGEPEDVDFAMTQLFSGRRKSKGNKMFDGLLQTALEIINKKLLSVSIDVFKDYLLSDSY